MPSGPTIAIVRSAKAQAGDLQSAEIRSLVRQAIELAGGLAGMVRGARTVVVKPNLAARSCPTPVGDRSYPREMSGAATDWRVTAAVVELVHEYNPAATIYVAEGSASQSSVDNMAYFKYSAATMPAVNQFISLEEDSGDWQDTASPGLVRVQLAGSLWAREYYLNRKCAEADVVISVPVLKSHSHTVVAGGLENVAIGSTPANIYGRSAGDASRFTRIPHDLNLHHWIHDYIICRPVSFVVMDGLQGGQCGPELFDSRGRLEPNQKNMRLILAGRDAVAVDAIASLVMGWDPQSVRYLGLLSRKGVGTLDTGRIAIAGLPVDRVRAEFAGPPPLLGGKQIPGARPPDLAIEKSVVTPGGELRLALAAGDQTVRAEIYLDGRLRGPAVTEEFGRAAFDVSDLPKGSHTLKVWSYDRFLNRAETIREIEA